MPVVHCKKSPYDVYIGRPSKWGNRWTHLRGIEGTAKVASRAEAIRRFEEWILTQPELLEAAKTELRGKTLGCWCTPKDCHGAVLERIANAH